MNDNTDRELILRVTIKDSEKAEWIWDSHLTSISTCGIKVNEIAEGEFYCIVSKDIVRLACQNDIKVTNKVI